MRILDEDDEKSLEQGIQAEENARIAAVNAEATARQSADNTLQGNINSEASTRAAAVQQINEKIGDIETLLAAI